VNDYESDQAPAPAAHIIDDTFSSRQERASADVDKIAAILALYFDVDRRPGETSIQLLDRAVDAACRFRATRENTC
jgi:hypothetical protein